MTLRTWVLYRLTTRLVLPCIVDQACVLNHDKEAMVPKQIDVATWQVSIIVDLLDKHLSEVLIRLLVLVVDQFLRELVHEVGRHSHDLSIIHVLLNFLVVGGRVVIDVPFEVLILLAHLDVVRRLGGG